MAECFPEKSRWHWNEQVCQRVKWKLLWQSQRLDIALYKNIPFPLFFTYCSVQFNNHHKSVIVLSPGLEIKLKNQHYPVFIAATDVPELLSVERSAAGVRLGVSTTLTTLKEVLQELVTSEPGMERLTISLWADAFGWALSLDVPGCLTNMSDQHAWLPLCLNNIKHWLIIWPTSLTAFVSDQYAKLLPTWLTSLTAFVSDQ